MTTAYSLMDKKKNTQIKDKYGKILTFGEPKCKTY